MTYLVMETFNTYAVLLDEEGRFVKSANPGYEIGMTIKNPVLMRDKPLEKRKTPSRLIAGIAAIAAMIALFFGVNFYQNNFVGHTSIFLAINPEVEMVLNKNGGVIEVNGANEDGIQLVEDFETASTDKIVVANELVDRAIEMGFLSEGGRVSIGIDTPDQVLFEEYGFELRQALDERISIVIEITDVEHMNHDPNNGASKYITTEEALDIAFSHAGVNQAQAVIEKASLDSNNGLIYYDVEFSIGGTEYEYEIHATSGVILDVEISAEDADDEVDDLEDEYDDDSGYGDDDSDDDDSGYDEEDSDDDDD